MLPPRPMPGSAQVLSNLGLAFLASGEPESALVYLDQAVASDPHSPTVLVNRAAALEALARFDEAEHQLRCALEVDPGFVPALYNEAILVLSRGDSTRARALARSNAVSQAVVERRWKEYGL